MKTLTLFLLLAAFVVVISQSDKTFHAKEQDFLVVNSINGIFKDHFALKESIVDLVYCGPKSESLAGKLLREKPLEVSVRVIRLDAIQKAPITYPTIFLFDSEEDFEKYKDKLNRNVTITELKILPNLLYFVQDKDKRKLDGNFKELYMSSIENGNFIKIINDTTVDLVTSFFFEPGKCRQAQYKTINRFSISNMKWDNETFFPEKYDNYNGCELKIIIDDEKSFKKSIPATTTTTNKTFDILAQNLNFKNNFVKLGPATLVNFDFDLMNFVSGQSIHSFGMFDFSSPLYSDSLTLTVPAGEPYTQLEQMFLMFDKATWICIGATLGGALFIIQVINCMSVRIQKFVFGRDVRSPTLNVANIFLNGAQMRVPGRNFARFMLMMFITWSLIIRTCHQSMLYKNLQQDMRKPRIKTLDELNQANFTIILNEQAEILLGKEFIKR
jgi:hypothetical protein